MRQSVFISVILPIKLEWNPYYSVDYKFIESGSLKRGTRVNVTIVKQEYVGVVDKIDVTPNTAISKILPINSIAESLPAISEEELELWQFVSEYYLCTVGEVYKAAYTEDKIIEQKNSCNSFNINDIVLSDAQTEVYNKINASFLENKTVLLDGITGSGKTEIYIKLASEVLAKGKSILYLIPEIALSNQLEDRLKQIYSDNLIIFHSGITKAKKRDAIRKMAEGSYILLGTRSSIFLPHKNLGLIIVDEENDVSYKQDSPAPRYNGRDIAIVLGQIHNSNVILGSATPSLESLYNCITGRYIHIKLNQRYYGAENADVEIIDTKAERRKRGMKGDFSIKLIKKINEVLSRGSQALILRNVKSYSPFVQCEDCGDIPKCPHCNVSLSYNKSTNKLICHYCGYREIYTGICHKCNGMTLPKGAGTQKIEEETGELFPSAKVARLDGDLSSAADRKKIIRDFAAGNIDILIGTQIVAKGFDFKNLMLVAVINADSFLGVQDFRADERSLQLLEQFRGRCGRRDTKGIFIIQTATPEHPIYKKIKGELQVDKDIISQMLNERKIFNYPPFSRLVNIIIKDNNLKRIEKMSYLLYDIFSDKFNTIGPYAPVIDMIGGKYIRHIRITLNRDKFLKDNKHLIYNNITTFERDKKYTGHIIIDVDPYQ
jgi:hypothetical protein